MAGLAFGVIPFIPLLADAQIRGHMLGYSPPVSEWGIAMILHWLFQFPPLAHAAHSIMSSYLMVGRWIIVGVAVLVGCIAFQNRRWGPYELGTLVYATLLVFAPGFGPQYTVIIVPLLLAVSIRRGWLYGVFAGAFLATSYFSRLVSYELPLRTLYPPNSPPPPGSVFGLIAWLILLWTLLELIWPKKVAAKA